jgi:aryl-alcohol dehydrogenase-like predicted oxidoreductase
MVEGMGATVTLGDREIPRIGLGTNRLRHTPEHVAFVQSAVQAGIRLIDTAHLYTHGESERTIGAALSPVPDGCIVATKGGYGGAGRGRPDVLRQEIEESLTRLRTDRIELYYLHRVDPETPIEDSLGAVLEYVERGTIRHVGISEVDVAQIERARRVVPIVAVQNNYSLAERKHDAVVDYCASAGIVFVPFFPLAGAQEPRVRAIASRHGATSTQIALAWLLRRSPVMLPIPGTLSAAHVEENLAALSIALGDDEFEALRNADRRLPR